MSFIRLLSAGRSFVGLDDNANRYRMASAGILPKFGSPRNPFEPSLKSELGARSPGAALRPPAPKAEEGGAAESEKDVEPETTPTASPAAQEGQSKGADSALGNPGILPVKAPTVPGDKVGQKSQPGTPAPTARTSASPGGRGGSWFGKLWGKVTKPVRKPAGQPPRPASAQDVKPPVQTELSLDLVRVVRNDLSDADIEVVPQASRRPAVKKDLIPDAGVMAPAGLANAERV
jgi:hypothetical protein